MDDDQFIPLNLVIDEIGIANSREHPNTGNVGLAPKRRISR